MDRSPSLFDKPVTPYSDAFPDALRSYCEQMGDAVRKNKHHDQRRSLLLNFLREGLGLDPVEFELEKKVKAAAVRGRIDAFFKQLIIEVKTDLERERPDAESELKKYFESQANPFDYVGLVTDGLLFEVYIYEHGAPRRIRVFKLDAESPLTSFQHLDQLLFTARRLIPDSSDIVSRFGVYSAAYNAIRRSLLEAFEGVQNENAVRVKFREWNVLLSKVYGSEIGDPALFVTHTYLVMLSRAIVAVALFPTEERGLQMYRGIVDGAFFRQNKLVNLAEPDFFTWALGTDAEQTLLENIGRIFACLDIYDFHELDGDILKELYQDLVDPRSRHELGEYYTPDWLAELVLDKIDYRWGSVLDPSCGSGSFLYAAARRLRRVLNLDKGRMVRTVMEDIIGIDVHPVAVLMAKANLLLSMRQDIAGFRGDIRLQVYMADTLVTGEDKGENNLVIPVSENHESFRIPIETIHRLRGFFDPLIERLCVLAERGAESPEMEKRVLEALPVVLEDAQCSQTETFFWQQNFRLLLRLVREKRNTIWAYILTNVYRPVYLRQTPVDCIVGNPPWLSYRFITNAEYKKRVKELTFEHNLLEKTDRNLFTQMDTSTVFFAHCQRDFLKPGGKMAFVMPKSAMVPAKQHLRFQQMGFTEILDFSGVKPLFNVRSCVLIRGKEPKIADIPCEEYRGDFKGKRNLRLAEARVNLETTRTTHSFAPAGTEYSPYHSEFFQGATLVPRCLWFVEPADPATVATETPYVRTPDDVYANAKNPWKKKIDGLIEKEFLFGTVLAKDLIPFVVRRLSLLVLPVSVSSAGSLDMIDSGDALARNFVHAHDWFRNAETIWESSRKTESHTVFQWLNYENKLTKQPFRSAFFVLYNASGTNLSASLITIKEARRAGPLAIRGFVVDSKCYWFATDSEEEAHYLVGILNSAFVNMAIKPLQTQGLQGERDIHRRPFEACNIPLFDHKNKRHKRIAELAKECRARLLPVVPKMDAPVATMRREAREIVSGLLAKLDAEVAVLLKSSPRKLRSRAKGHSKQDTLFE